MERNWVVKTLSLGDRAKVRYVAIHMKIEQSVKEKVHGTGVSRQEQDSRSHRSSNHLCNTLSTDGRSDLRGSGRLGSGCLVSHKLVFC